MPLDQSISVGGYRNYARSYKWGVNDRLRELPVAGRSRSFKFGHDAVGNLAAATYPDHSQDLRVTQGHKTIIDATFDRQTPPEAPTQLPNVSRPPF